MGKEKLLYHGTTEASAANIEKVGIILSRGRRFLDFGQGFYLTDDKGIARERDGHKFEPGAVLAFSADFEGLNVKRFGSFSEEWCDFVYRCRFEEWDTQEYDLIIGPIADARMRLLFQQIRKGALSRQEVYDQIRMKKVINQFVIKTEKGVSHLVLRGRVQ